MEEEGVERPEATSAEEVIIEQIAQDVNLTPFTAKIRLEQMHRYFQRFLSLELGVAEGSLCGWHTERPLLACTEMRGTGSISMLHLPLKGPDDQQHDCRFVSGHWPGWRCFVWSDGCCRSAQFLYTAVLAQTCGLTSHRERPMILDPLLSVVSRRHG